MRLRAFLALALAGATLFGLAKVIPLVTFALTPLDSASTQTLTVEVAPGQNTLELSRQLEAEGIIESARQFHRLGRYTRKWDGLKVGEYELAARMTPLEIFATLNSGISIARKVTVREGWNMYQIADLLASMGLVDRRRFLTLCKDPAFIRSLGNFPAPVPRTLEGYLFPETYFFGKKTGEEQILRTFYARFLENWDHTLDEKAARLGFNRHQIVTLASIIEKETGAPEERPLISSVFHNRLKKKMRLQSDPTTIYGIWERFDGNLRRKDLLEKTDHNTYAIPALPVGPIANPGKEALQAAVHPANSEFLFFVSKNDGTHSFSATFKDHSKAVQKFQLDRNAREGKSWRDLQRSREANGSRSLSR